MPDKIAGRVLGPPRGPWKIRRFRSPPYLKPRWRNDIVRVIEQEYVPISPSTHQVEHEYVSEHGGLHLQDDQVRFLNHAFTPKRVGKKYRLPYPTVIYSDLKKCVSPSTKILTDDFEWKEARLLQRGDKVISLDEEPGMDGSKGGSRRRYRVGTVLSTDAEQMPSCTLHFSDGSKLDCSMEHPLLARVRGGQNLRWREAKDFKVGDRIPRYFDMWERDESWDGGYMAGFLDGEGHLAKKMRGLNFGQKENEAWHEALRILDKHGIAYNTYKQRGVYNGHDYTINKCDISSRKNMLRVLGTFRPRRLLAKARPMLDDIGKIQSRESVTIVDIEHQLFSWMIKLEVDEKTFFSEGFASHNSGKTGLLGALFHAWSRVYGGECFSLSNSRDQSRERAYWRVYLYLSYLQREFPEKYEALCTRQDVEWIEYQNPYASIRPLPVAPGTSAGAFQSLTGWDELWDYDREAALRLYSEMQPIPTIPDVVIPSDFIQAGQTVSSPSVRLVHSYAGYYGQAPLLYQLYEDTVNEDPDTGEPRGIKVKGLEDLPVYVSEDGRTLAWWNMDVPRMPWQTPAFIEAARQDPINRLRPEEFRRLWMNRWTSGSESFIDMDLVRSSMARGKERGLYNVHPV